MKLLESLNWRYATKKFDPAKKVSKENLEKIKEAIRLSPSSYGLQLYKVLIVEDKEIRGKLKPAAWNQTQITDASQLLVFCNYARVLPEHIDEYLEIKAGTQNLQLNDLKVFGDFMKEKVLEQSPEDLFQWTAKQVYIALGNLLVACAELGIDTCPMEGFEASKFNEILQLNDRGLNAAVLATIGYRAHDDVNQHLQKTRKPKELLFETL